MSTIFLTHSNQLNLEQHEKLPLVSILLCTFNGALYLAEQLNSIENQIYKNWILVVSDDGSTDKTIDILLQYQKKWDTGKLIIRNGPQKGFSRNFLSLACDEEIRADFYAFCDQDDVWLPRKLKVALSAVLANEMPEKPFLYCGRTRYVNKVLKPCGISPLFIFPKTFRNALVQSIAGGNTMVFNLSAKLIIEEAGITDVPSHDWWLYLLVTGVGGDVFYDEVPQILYRQHEHSIVGENNSLSAKIDRFKMLMQGRYHSWNTKNINSLKKVNHLMIKENYDILKIFEVLRSACLKDRVRLMGICGLYRQTRRGTFSLIVANILKKI
jgi:glycosyltransferase involved in cell wall biosynthesis